MIVEKPTDMQWFEGDLPDVHVVPSDCCVMAWFILDLPGNDWHGKLVRIETVRPREDSLNPLSWCDSRGHPIGFQEKVIYWAWVAHPLLIGKLL
jgi:hypothetical protein